MFRSKFHRVIRNSCSGRWCVRGDGRGSISIYGTLSRREFLNQPTNPTPYQWPTRDPIQTAASSSSPQVLWIFQISKVSLWKFPKIFSCLKSCSKSSTFFPVAPTGSMGDMLCSAKLSMAWMWLRRSSTPKQQSSPSPNVWISKSSCTFVDVVPQNWLK